MKYAWPRNWLRGHVCVWLTAAAVAIVACGGSGGDTISEEEATEATNRYLATTLGLFTGVTDPQAFIDQYAPECREGIDVSDLAFVSAFMQALAPALQGIEIEAVDAGALTIEDVERGVQVLPRDPNAMRVQVEGVFVPASQFFGDAGLVPAESEFGEPLLLVRRDGGIYVGDCDELTDLTDGLGGS